ncbi:simple sugar transport system permease protein [Candidatus Hakubella thermalkaliphila]|uniref:Simple sugar transport system permease protein n=2 Tax=Candidatus Hakubella thermalkaliphila TaxID=2754717 RepID=A0A6V8NUB5_9ACTN|nr:ABC transporter permease [Candidatus Hakubella thermalkaliphila]MBT9170470.1 hypothetical protein [Actinomycetota bacterium]GFP22086.1 simple sugar transport system permease protein [Candidatus Hakubella thermalkaliphila]
MFREEVLAISVLYEMLPTLLNFTLAFGAVTAIAAMGGVIAERSGVINIALEGIMRIGAFTSVTAAYFWGYHFSNDPIFFELSPWIGLLAAILGGALAGLLHAYICVTWKGNQIVNGVAINIFSYGGMTYLLMQIFGTAGHSPPVPLAFANRPIVIPWIDPYSFLGKVLWQQTVFTYIALVLPILLYLFLFETTWGLRLRAVGEHPRAADTLGINVFKSRYFAVIVSGVLAGIAGANISLGISNLFTIHVPAGGGFIALAAMIFGKWNPLGALGASFFFAFFRALEVAIAVSFPALLAYIPRGVFLATPYLLTILVLAGFVGRAVPPQAIGQPYEKG